MLFDLGVDQLEVGNPAISKDEVKDIKEIAKMNLGLRLTCWSRAVINELKNAVRLESKASHFISCFKDSP